ncbi:MAG: zinc ribbon domain-containing protein [Sphaerochaetaceae bacterium]
MEKKQYVCPKCGCIEFDSDTIQTTGGNLSRLFDVQNKRFIAVSCRRCGYTEFYKQESSLGMNILDLLIGG